MAQAGVVYAGCVRPPTIHVVAQGRAGWEGGVRAAPGSAAVSDGAGAEREGEAVTRIPTHAELLAATRHWWRGYRPLAWRLDRHLAHPAINTCTARDHRFALVVAATYGERREKARRRAVTPRASARSGG